MAALRMIRAGLADMRWWVVGTSVEGEISIPPPVICK
jgi:hypothetical protein